jgi:hypothetical protein
MINNEMAMIIGAVFLGVFSAILAAWIVRAVFLILSSSVFWMVGCVVQFVRVKGCQVIDFIQVKIAEHRANVK